MHLRQDACVFEVADAHVVRREREPGAIRLQDALGNLIAHPHEVARAAEDAAARIQSVRHVQGARRFFGEHHEPAYAGVRSRGRIPLRLLIAHRREQSPVDTDFRRSLAEPVAITRQARLDVFEEHARLDVIEAVAVAVVRIEDGREPAFRGQRGIERRDAPQQARVARVDHPRERLALGKIECDADFRMEGAADRELVRIGDGVVELAPRQPVEQLFGFRQRILDPRQVRIQRAPLLQRRGVRAAADDLDVALVGLLDRARPRLALAKDQVLAHLLVRRAEARVVRQADAAGQSRRRDVRTVRFQLAHRIGHVRYGIDEQAHAQLGGKTGGEIELRPLWARGAQVIGARQVASHDAQLAGAHDLLQHGRRLRAGAEQQSRDDGQGGFQGAVRRRLSTGAAD